MNAPHQNMVNLHFRKAFDEYANEGMENPNPFQKWLRILRGRLGNDFRKEDQWYWDILFEVNVRGKNLEELIGEESKNDPEKDRWIRDFVEGRLEKKVNIIVPGRKI